MIYKKLESITINDLRNLIDNEVCEGKTLEYKSELKIGNGDEKKEFLADITSFANTDGGDIIFGIKENSSSHLPVEINGIEVKNEDELIRQIESILRDSVSPRIPDVSFKLVSLFNSTYVLIIRIGLSLLLPHMIVYKGSNKFFSRNAKGKYPMDVNELRTAFTMSHSLEQEIETYKKERLLSIKENQYHELVPHRPYFVFFSIPISAFRNNKLFEIKKLMDITSTLNLNIFSEKSLPSITIDAIKLSSRPASSPSKSSFGYYKTNGIVEKATTSFFFPPDPSGSNNFPYVSNDYLLRELLALVDELKEYYIKLDISSPVLLSCAFINAKHYSLGTMRQQKMDRDLAITPNIYLENLSIETEVILRPMLDSIWNAFGYESCDAYNGEGKFVELK